MDNRRRLSSLSAFAQPGGPVHARSVPICTAAPISARVLETDLKRGNARISQTPSAPPAFNVFDRITGVLLIYWVIESNIYRTDLQGP